MPEDLDYLLPMYVNGKLPPDQRMQVEAWLEHDPQVRLELEMWQLLRTAIHERPTQNPSQQVWVRLQQQVELDGHRLPRLVISVLAGFSLAFATLMILWITIRPGVLLQWSVSGSAPAAYRIYRAPAGSQDFVLLGEVAGRESMSHYSYLDVLFIPGRPHAYQVEGITTTGDPIVSQRVESQSLAALPGQMAILLASILLGVLGAQLVRNWGLSRPNRFATA